mmetsp:Transcript_20663/g.79240  ORF Transcript_20663/g.79240 Transcript_20663/m.79240 type:complete len:201 (+) Transcript_20663:1440-2042(+)
MSWRQRARVRRRTLRTLALATSGRRAAALWPPLPAGVATCLLSPAPLPATRPVMPRRRLLLPRSTASRRRAARPSLLPTSTARRRRSRASRRSPRPALVPLSTPARRRRALRRLRSTGRRRNPASRPRQALPLPCRSLTRPLARALRARPPSRLTRRSARKTPSPRLRRRAALPWKAKRLPPPKWRARRRRRSRPLARRQ